MMTINCRECGAEENRQFAQLTMNRMIEKQLCFTCDHWTKLLAHKDESIRLDNGFHYIDGGKSNGPSHAKGHGGHRWLIEFFDGRVIDTDNLWCQGTIPEHFKSRLPVNAKVIQDVA